MYCHVGPVQRGWGQFDTARIVEFTRKLDPTRLVNNASGWADRNVGDVHDVHVYPGPGMPPLSRERAVVLGEFGGLGLPLEGTHLASQGHWGYRSFTTRDGAERQITCSYSAIAVAGRQGALGSGLHRRRPTSKSK